MSPHLCKLLVLAAALLSPAHASAAPVLLDQITGVVKDQATTLPISGAKVTLQTTTYSTTTLGDGSYTLFVPAGIDLVIVAAKVGYFSGSVEVTSPAASADIDLDWVPIADEANYLFLGPSGCSFCHYDTVLDWSDTPMARAGYNTWVHDIYSGTGTAGGMGGFVYTRDSVHAGANLESECAACHQPERWIENGFSGALDDQLVNPVPAVDHGISCEVCHKIASIDESKVNFPGIHPDAVTFNRPVGLYPEQMQYGVLSDVDYENTFAMRSSYQPQLVAEVCAACHQDKNDPDGNGDFEEPNGVISEPTYLEWLNSDYSDENSPTYANCVDCHMPPSGKDTVCNALFPPLVRDPETIRSHKILGTTPEFLENAVDLVMTVNQSDSTVDVQIDITNSMTGHHVPTGVTIRNMILLVEAWTDGGDPLDDALISLGTQTVHDLGGVGDPAQGYYAEMPGKFFGKVNHDASMSGPTFFTDATGILFDSRIPALATDSTNYSFLAPAEGQTVQVRARLIYRRSFRFLTDAKGWTQDGHGNPLADVIGPDFGHLMESAQDALTVTGPWSNAGFAKAGSYGLPVLQGVGTFAGGSSNSLELSNALESATTYFVMGLTAINAPLKGGILVPAPDFLFTLSTDGAGQMSIPFTWPIGVPPGFELFHQMWITDPGASNGFAASNGLKTTTY